MVVRVRSVAAGQSGTAPVGTEISITDGSSSKVELDSTAQVRGTIDLTTDGTGRWPARVADLLAPYGRELFIERGVQLGGGTSEWCSLGYFRIETVDQAAPPDGPIRVEGSDRNQGIIDARLLAPVQYLASATYGQVVSDLVTEVYPTAVIEWDDATDAEAIGRDLIAEEKRYEFIDDLVTALGKIWYWDHRGILVIRTPPAPSDPVWDVNAGEGGVLVTMSRTLSRKGVYNAVVASGEATGTDAPVRGVAVNDNPASPTYYGGAFGPVPRFYSSPFLLTPVQATDAAASLLTQQLGLPYNVDFTAVPNPALEPLDPVRITYSDRAAPEVHVLQKLTVPLTESGTLDATTREQTVVLIGRT